MRHTGWRPCKSEQWHICVALLWIAVAAVSPTAVTQAFTPSFTEHPRTVQPPGRCRSYAAAIGNRHGVSLLIPGVSFSNDDNVVSALGLVDRFDRWRFLQKLLDEEDHPNETTAVLFALLTAFLESHVDSDDEPSSPILTEKSRQVIQDVTQEQNVMVMRQLLTDLATKPDVTTSPEAALLSNLKQLLPDPNDDEDAFKSLWDTIIELHGRESVKINERHGGTVSWQTRCLVARILLHYDFLTKGL